MEQLLYSRDDVGRIAHAYGRVFPSVSPELASYWGYDRQRPWSCLTSDFRVATFEQFARVHEAAGRIDAMPYSGLGAKGAALRTAALEARVGYSLGINAWADHLLFHTYREDLSSLTIILAHDWYPVATTDRKGRWRRSDAPLRTDDNLEGTTGYHAGAPECVHDGGTVALYLNLYPDYRPPGGEKTGDVRDTGLSYARCLTGLDALVACLNPSYKDVSLVSWGTKVWEQLARRTASPKGLLLTTRTRNFPGQALRVELGGRSIPYLPIMHPSMASNFSQKAHYRHLALGFRELGLGLPGGTRSTGKCVMDARAVLL